MGLCQFKAAGIVFVFKQERAAVGADEAGLVM
jgi:hypothetical protein